MQKLQDSLFSILRTSSLSPAVFNYLQPTDEGSDRTPLGGVLNDAKYGWLALGPKFCVVDLKTGLKVSAWTFGVQNNTNTTVTSVVQLSSPLTEGSNQLIISLECEDGTGLICIFHVNGSQILRCIQTEVVVTELAVCDGVPDGPFECFDGVILAGSKTGEIMVFDLNRAGLVQALREIAHGYEHLVRNESNMSSLIFLPLKSISEITEQREVALENEDHIAVLLNENSILDGQYLFHNPDGTIRMKAKRDHVRVSTIQYVPQLGSLAVGFNFGAFQIWNVMTLALEYTSQVNVECLPVTHFGFIEPCDDPRAFCYLWVVYSLIDRFDEEVFPFAAMYSLTYQGKRLLSDTKYLYQDFVMSNIRFQLELTGTEGSNKQLVGGRCVSCHTYSINSTLGEEGEDSMLNICQLVWECWGGNSSAATDYGMLLFDLDQWYKAQMPATYELQSNTFMSVTTCSQLSRADCRMLDVRLVASSVAVYCHAERLEEHFYPNSLQYSCVCLNTSEIVIVQTAGVQRQTLRWLLELGERGLLEPTRMYSACVACGLVPLCASRHKCADIEEQRRFLLSVALEGRLTQFLMRCAHQWATGTHAAAGLTLPFMVDWCWSRAIELKENAKELTAPLFHSSSLPDRNVVRCLEHCVRQLTQLTSMLDGILTECCNLVVPDALGEIEEKYKGLCCVALYFQVVQWFLGVGLLPERHEGRNELPYPALELNELYRKRRIKLHRLENPHSDSPDDEVAGKSCSLLYIDQLIENECGGDRIHGMWRRAGSECSGLYPPPTLYSLLRLYLLPDIADEHKHSLVLYLLVDYSMVYDEMRYESVIRRLMQFPTMFGLSNTAIKATQAFWHLDHRDFDFALDQLQCLTGNNLSEWQHNVVLSALLAQKKIQQALQYLHVRKPAPIQNDDRTDCRRGSENLNDWQSCCNLYLARGLVFEALDVIRTCVQNSPHFEDKMLILGYFFSACRLTGQLSKLLEVSLMPLEENTFIKFLENSNDRETSDILVMFYLQQARYLEAQQYNNRIRNNKMRLKDMSASLESIIDFGLDRDGARDTLVEAICSSLPTITGKVAHCAINDFDSAPQLPAPKPMSVFVQSSSPRQTFTYKSSFIHDTIENASETWINKPNMRRGLKRALNIEDTPFLCTPKLNRNKSFTNQDLNIAEDLVTPSKRARLDFSNTPKTPKMRSAVKVSEKVSKEIETLLDMPEVQTPPNWKLRVDRSREATPHSILKVRRAHTMEREAASPVDSRYLGESEDELIETESNHTHCSDSTNKHLRFTIPTESEGGSTPSPVPVTRKLLDELSDTPRPRTPEETREMEYSETTYRTSATHSMQQSHILESPPKKFAADSQIKSRRSYKDSVRARSSLSISANSSLADEPNNSIESIADIPITLINPRYSGEGKHRRRDVDMSIISIDESQESIDSQERSYEKSDLSKLVVDISPKGRRSIRNIESTPVLSRSRSQTPERLDSPIVTPMSTRRMNRSRTPEPSPRASPLAPIVEQPQVESEQDLKLKSAPMTQIRNRSRSRTPERLDKVIETPKLEPITESPTKEERTEKGQESPRKNMWISRTPERIDKGVSEVPNLEVIVDSPKNKDNTEAGPSSPRRSLRSRSRTPEVEMAVEPPVLQSPRRGRSKTPEREKIITPEKPSRTRKSLSRMVLEHNMFSKSKQADKTETEENRQNECTPMKPNESRNLLDMTFSPIQKSILQSPSESFLAETTQKDESTPQNESTEIEIQITDKSTPQFGSLSESLFDKSVLKTYHSDMDVSQNESTTKPKSDPLPNISTLTHKSMLNESSLLTSDSDMEVSSEKVQEQLIEKEKRKIGEIEREISEIEEGIGSGKSDSDSSDSDSDDDESSGDDDANSEEEVISIGDSSENESSNASSDNKLQIDEQVNIYQGIDMTDNKQENNKDMDMAQDPLCQASVSMMTDDNSANESDQSDMNLNYSDETKDGVKEVQSEEIKEPSKQTSQGTEETTIPTETVPTTQSDQKTDEANQTQTEEKLTTETEKPKTRKRGNSTSSNKSDKSDTKSPKKRTKSTDKDTETDDKRRNKSTKNTQIPSGSDQELEKTSTDNISEDPKITDLKDEVKTPRKRTKSTTSNEDTTRSRSQTPTSSRRILTRRVSKEMSEPPIPEESEDLTPRRSRELKEEKTRKSRKSILPSKPDLSVIPEMSTEDGFASKLEDSSDIIKDVSASRRLTRRQKTVLESWLEPGRVSRTDSKASIEDSDDDASSISIDVEKVSTSKDARLARAMSETKSLKKSTPTRRASVDITRLKTPEPSASGEGVSPYRPRRASFTKACEAIHTPKGRRTSTDVRETDSRPESPATVEPVTPARRTRRTSSTQSNTSITKTETPKRGRRAAADKDAKK